MSAISGDYTDYVSTKQRQKVVVRNAIMTHIRIAPVVFSL